MSRDKQIEEMRKIICLSYGKGECRQCYDYEDCSVTSEAERLYNAGYRKSTDVSEEIFAEIEAIKCVGLLPSSWVKQFAELKKKYTQGKAEIPPYVRMEAKALPATLNVKYTEGGE